MNLPMTYKKACEQKQQLMFLTLLVIAAFLLFASSISFGQIPTALPTSVTDGITNAFTFLGLGVAAMVGVAALFKLGKWVYGFFV